MASRYCPLLTCRNMSDMHAALDSSKADNTLHEISSVQPGFLRQLINSRPYPINLLFHPYLLLPE